VPHWRNVDCCPHDSLRQDSPVWYSERGARSAESIKHEDNFKMNSEFSELHANCVAAMRAYFVEAEKTSSMLAKCTAEPLSFTERLDLLSQEIIENESYTRYVDAKILLHTAARLGYGSSN
jgi:hypothetical protein